jgi:pimeloyl-ACP methyl ester carboxylesterase
MPNAPDLIANEEAIVFGTNVRLVGIVTAPSPARTAAEPVGVIFLNAGVVHRVGPSRLYVALARRLSAAGFTALRFDHSGVGDSPPRDDQLAFDESSVAETVDAMNWLAAERRCRSFVLVGLCSGTLTAFRAAQIDPRVRSLVLLTALLVDPSTVPEEIVAEMSNRRVARSYLVEKAGSRRAWRRIFSGKADYHRMWRAVRTFIGRRLKPARLLPGHDELVDRVGHLLDRGVSLQFVYAEPTTVLEWFRMALEPALPSLRTRGRIELHLVKRADHTFTQLQHQAHVIDLVTTWVERCM